MRLSVRRIISSINYRVIGPLTGRPARNWTFEDSLSQNAQSHVEGPATVLLD